MRLLQNCTDWFTYARRDFSLKVLAFYFFIGLAFITQAFANPVGGTVAAGNISIQQSATTTTIQQSSTSGIINWQSFNIGANETTNFIQPTNGVTLNRINPAQGASQIYGHLTANGQIILINGAGIYFGPNSQVNVGGIIASTADISDQNFLNGAYLFSNPAVQHGVIVNDGSIIAAKHGLVALMADGVVNNGYLQANSGQVVLASGEAFTLGFDQGNLINFAINQNVTHAGVTKSGKALSTGIDNQGSIVANGGKILVSAAAAAGVLNQVINLQGVVSANTVRAVKGQIIISAGAGGNLKVGAKISAKGKHKAQVGGSIELLGSQILLTNTADLNVSGGAGGGQILIGGNARGVGPLQSALSTLINSGAKIAADALVNGNGGQVVVWSTNDTEVAGSISALGGAQGGNGGSVETSGAYLDINQIAINLYAPKGTVGTWLLDPTDVYIADNAADAAAAGDTSATTTSPSSVYTGYSTATTYILTSVLDAALGVSGTSGANITITTTSSQGGGGNIVLVSPLTWGSTHTLTLTASNNILLNAPITATLGSLVLNALLPTTLTSTAAGATISSSTSSTSPFVPATNGVSAAISVANLTINQGAWYQNSNGAALPTLAVSGNFYISPNAQFLRVAGGNGTLGGNSPFLISDIFGLQGIGSSTVLEGDYFKLNQNINAAVTQYWVQGSSNSQTYGDQGFNPINLGNGFSGELNGGGYTISNLYQKIIATNNDLDATGLIGILASGAILQNISLTNATILATDVQEAFDSNYNYIGGVGGLVGSSQGSITNSNFSGNIIYTESGLDSYINVYIGGLVGNGEGGSISTSSSSGTITVNSATSLKYSGGFYNAPIYYIGGLVGNNQGTIAQSFANVTTDFYDTNYYSTNSNSGQGPSFKIGGFVGENSSGSISDSFSSGTINHETSGSQSAFDYEGGFVGLNYATITNAISNVEIIEQTTGAAAYLGAFVGKNFNSNSIITNGFWNNTSDFYQGGAYSNLQGSGGNYGTETITGGCLSNSCANGGPNLSLVATYQDSNNPYIVSGSGGFNFTSVWASGGSGVLPFLQAFADTISGLAVNSVNAALNGTVELVDLTTQEQGGSFQVLASSAIVNGTYSISLPTAALNSGDLILAYLSGATDSASNPVSGSAIGILQGTKLTGFTLLANTLSLQNSAPVNFNLSTLATVAATCASCASAALYSPAAEVNGLPTLALTSGIGFSSSALTALTLDANLISSNGIAIAGTVTVAANPGAGSNAVLLANTGLAPITISGSTLNLNSGITLTLLNVDANSQISAQITGAGNLAKQGSGTISLVNNSNNYTGTTAIQGGILVASTPQALGTSSAISLASGELALNFGSNGGTLADQTPLNLAGTASIVDLDSAGTDILANALVLANASTPTLSVGSGATLTLSGAVNGAASGQGALFLSGAGTLNLENTVGATPLASLNSSVTNLNISTNVVSTSGAQAYSGTVNTTGANGITFTGAVSANVLNLNNSGGSVTFINPLVATSLNSSANTSAITFNGINVTNAATLLNTGGLTLNATSVFTGGLTATAGSTTLNGSLQAANIQLGAVSLSGSADELDSTLGGVSATGGNISVGAITGNASNLSIDAGTGGTVAVGSFNGTGNLDLINSDGAAFNGSNTAASVTVHDTQANQTVAFNNLTTSGSFSTEGSDPYVLSLIGINTIDGTSTFAHSGSVLLGGSTTFEGTATATVTASVTVNTGSTVHFESQVATSKLVNNGTINAGANLTATDLTGTNANADIATSAGQTVNVAPTTTDTYAGLISGNANFTLGGSGNLTLSHAQTYTGMTTINSGATLTLTAASSLGALLNNGQLALQNNLSFTNLSGAGVIAIGSTDTLTLSPTQADVYAGSLSGAGALVVNGTGNLELSQANSYSGGTQIQSGILQDNAATSGLGSGSVQVSTGAELALNAASLSNNIAINGAGSGGGAIATVAGTNALLGAVSLSGNATVTATHASDVLTLTLASTQSAAETLTLSGAGTIIVRSNAASVALAGLNVNSSLAALDLATPAIITTNAQNYAAPVNLENNFTATAGTNISFDNGVNGGNSTLTLVADNGGSHDLTLAGNFNFTNQSNPSVTVNGDSTPGASNTFDLSALATTTATINLQGQANSASNVNATFILPTNPAQPNIIVFGNTSADPLAASQPALACSNSAGGCVSSTLQFSNVDQVVGGNAQDLVYFANANAAPSLNGARSGTDVLANGLVVNFSNLGIYTAPTPPAPSSSSSGSPATEDDYSPTVMSALSSVNAQAATTPDLPDETLIFSSSPTSFVNANIISLIEQTQDFPNLTFGYNSTPTPQKSFLGSSATTGK